MSLVSNFISNISNIGASGIQPAQNFDLSDTTFEKLLEKQLQTEVKESQPVSGLGMPPGFEINPLDMSIDISKNIESEIFDFAKKQAANLYNKYSRSVVTDVSEFVEDIKNMI